MAPVRWELTFPGGLTEAEAEREIDRQREGTGLPREAFRLALCEGGTYAVLLRVEPWDLDREDAMDALIRPDLAASADDPPRRPERAPPSREPPGPKGEGPGEGSAASRGGLPPNTPSRYLPGPGGR